MAINPWLKLRSEVRKAGDRIAGQLATTLQAEIQKRLKEQAQGPSRAGSPPAIATGELANSWQTVKTNSGERFVGSNVVYARIHEFGGWVRPKRTTYLPVPIAGELSKRIRAAAGVSLRNYPGPGHLVVRPGASGKLILYLAPGPAGAGKRLGRLRRSAKPRGTRAPSEYAVEPDAGDLQPVFVLSKAVYIPLRPYVRPAIEAAKTAAGEIVKAQIAQAFAAAGWSGSMGGAGGGSGGGDVPISADVQTATAG